MSYSPPRWLESLGESLVPPSCAEHVLGDLAESSSSDAEYLAHLTSILPRVIWSQVRRRATLVGLAFNAFLTLMVLAPSLGFPKAPFFAEPWALLRAAGPWAIWVIGSALAAAYGPRDKPRAWSWKVYIGSAVVTIGVAVLLGVPLVRMLFGLALLIGLSLVLAMPWLAPWKPTPLSLETLHDHALQFQRTIWWRNARESFAASIVLFFNGLALWKADAALARAGNLILIVGVLFVIAFMHLRAGSRSVPRGVDPKTILEFHGREIARQRDMLRSVPYWYLLPFVPGMVVITASNWKGIAPAAVGGAIILGVFALIWKLNARGARMLDRDLEKVKALETQL